MRASRGVDSVLLTLPLPDSESSPDPQGKREEIIRLFRENIGALKGAQGFGVDDIIDPRDTRKSIIQILEAMPNGKQEYMPPKKHGIVPI